MEVKKKIVMFKRLRWMGLLFGIIMYCATFMAFGDILAILLGVAASVGFYMICSVESTRTMCQYVADDLKNAVTEAGHNRCIVEIKCISNGLITRVYLIQADGLETRLNRAILERINRSWYRKSIWVTQILGMADESELEEAHEFLDDALLDDLKRKRGERWEDLDKERDDEERDDEDRGGKWG